MQKTVCILIKDTLKQGGLSQKEKQLNLYNIFSIFMFNELY